MLRVLPDIVYIHWGEVGEIGGKRKYRCHCNYMISHV